MNHPHLQFVFEKLQAHDENSEEDLNDEERQDSNAAVVQDLRDSLLVFALKLHDLKIKEQLCQHQQDVKDHQHHNGDLHTRLKKYIHKNKIIIIKNESVGRFSEAG